MQGVENVVPILKAYKLASKEVKKEASIIKISESLHEKKVVQIADRKTALDAQRSLRDVKYDYVQALLNLQSAVADLEDILGGPIL